MSQRFNFKTFNLAVSLLILISSLFFISTASAGPRLTSHNPTSPDRPKRQTNSQTERHEQSVSQLLADDGTAHSAVPDNATPPAAEIPPVTADCYISSYYLEKTWEEPHVNRHDTNRARSWKYVKTLSSSLEGKADPAKRRIDHTLSYVDGMPDNSNADNEKIQIIYPSTARGSESYMSVYHNSSLHLPSNEDDSEIHNDRTSYYDSLATDLTEVRGVEVDDFLSFNTGNLNLHYQEKSTLKLSVKNTQADKKYLVTVTFGKLKLFRPSDIEKNRLPATFPRVDQPDDSKAPIKVRFEVGTEGINLETETIKTASHPLSFDSGDLALSEVSAFPGFTIVFLNGTNISIDQHGVGRAELIVSGNPDEIDITPRINPNGNEGLGIGLYYEVQGVRIEEQGGAVAAQ